MAAHKMAVRAAADRSESGMATGTNTLLRVENLNAWYDESHALHGVDFDVRAGKVVTLLGRNGAGKSTTLRAIMGILRKRTGSIVIDGDETIGMRSRQIADYGVGYVPEERGIYASLTVKENLLLPPKLKPDAMDLDEIYSLFPNIRPRLSSRGSRLSGGEQQMLAIARVLRTGARLLLLDEPTEGLAPVIIDKITSTLGHLKERGFTIVLVEQNLRFALAIADGHYIVQEGRVIDHMSREVGMRNEQKIRKHLGL
jgi:branched-chain amino acid transport system ATP-binding protein